MTGGEVVAGAAAAAGKAVVAAGRNILNEDDSDKQLFRELAKDSPAMRAAAEAHARRLAVKQEIMLRLYRPLAKWFGVSQEYFATQFSVDMSEKMADIPDEYLTTPRASTAVPAMQGLSYSLDEPNLKEMYLNLLARASDSRSAALVHPSFAEMIKQLGPEEAAYLKTVLANPSWPIARVMKTYEDGGRYTLLNHLMDSFDNDEQIEESNLAVWVDNWVRLGLVHVTYEESYALAERYEWVVTRPEFAALREQWDDENGPVKWDHGILALTALGKKFAEVAIDSWESSDPADRLRALSKGPTIHVGPTPPPNSPDGTLWLDTSVDSAGMHTPE